MQYTINAHSRSHGNECFGIFPSYEKAITEVQNSFDLEDTTVYGDDFSTMFIAKDAYLTKDGAIVENLYNSVQIYCE